MLYLYICIVLRYIGSRRYRYIHFITVCVITVNFANGITVFQTINLVCMRSVSVCAVNFHRIVSKKLFHSGFIGGFGFTGNRICGLTSYRINNRRITIGYSPFAIHICKDDRLNSLIGRHKRMIYAGIGVVSFYILIGRECDFSSIAVVGIARYFADRVAAVNWAVSFVCMRSVFVCAVNRHSTIRKKRLDFIIGGRFGSRRLTSYRICHRRLVTRNGPRTIDIQKRDALLTLRIRIQHVAKKGFVVLVHICLRIRYSHVTGVSVCGITCKLTDFKSSIDQTVNAVVMLNFSVCAVDFNSVFCQQPGIRIGEVIWFWYCYSI